MHTFTAQVLSCGMEGGALWPGTGSYRLLPEGGGQCADTGVLI